MKANVVKFPSPPAAVAQANMSLSSEWLIGFCSAMADVYRSDYIEAAESLLEQIGSDIDVLIEAGVEEYDIDTIREIKKGMA